MGEQVQRLSACGAGGSSGMPTYSYHNPHDDAHMKQFQPRIEPRPSYGEDPSKFETGNLTRWRDRGADNEWHNRGRQGVQPPQRYTPPQAQQQGNSSSIGQQQQLVQHQQMQSQQQQQMQYQQQQHRVDTGFGEPRIFLNGSDQV